MALFDILGIALVGRPAGTAENSPALQRRELGCLADPVPLGTTEPVNRGGEVSVVPTALLDSLCALSPASELAGYFQRSLRDRLRLADRGSTEPNQFYLPVADRYASDEQTGKDGDNDPTIALTISVCITTIPRLPWKN